MVMTGDSILRYVMDLSLQVQFMILFTHHNIINSLSFITLNRIDIR